MSRRRKRDLVDAHKFIEEWVAHTTREERMGLYREQRWNAVNNQWPVTISTSGSSSTATLQIKNVAVVEDKPETPLEWLDRRIEEVTQLVNT